MRQLLTMATGAFMASDRRDLPGLTLQPIAYDPSRDLWRVLLTGEALPPEFEVPPGGYPKEGDVRVVVNALDQSLVVTAIETHDAMG